MKFFLDMKLINSVADSVINFEPFALCVAIQSYSDEYLEEFLSIESEGYSCLFEDESKDLRFTVEAVITE